MVGLGGVVREGLHASASVETPPPAEIRAGLLLAANQDRWSRRSQWEFQTVQRPPPPLSSTRHRYAVDLPRARSGSRRHCSH